MAELALVGADQPANDRHEFARDGAAFGCGQGRNLGAAEDIALDLAFQPCNRPVDDLHGRLIGFARGIAPGEQPMAFKNDAPRIRVFSAEFLQPQAEFEAGALPGQPADLVAEDFLGQFAAVLRGGDGDDRIRVHMVDMLLRHEGMQRRIDGSGAGIEVEGAMRQVADHLVLIGEAAIEALQRLQLLHVEGGETVELDGADIAAGALDPEHLDIATRQRIALDHLGRGVAAAIIGDALIGAEKVGAIEQSFRLAHAGRLRLVPQVRQTRAVVFPCHADFPPCRACRRRRSCGSNLTKFRSMSIMNDHFQSKMR